MTFKLYLDTRGHSSTDECPVKICINHRSKTAFIGTGRRVLPSQWDARLQKVVAHPRAEQINKHLQHRLLDAIDLAERLQDAGLFRGKNATEIKDILSAELDPLPAEKPKGTFLNAYDDFTATKINPNTHKRYVTTKNRILAFDAKAGDLLLEEITFSWLSRFDAFMATDAPAANARAVHMRNIRTVFNFAIDDNRTTHYPFRRYKIKHEATIKRNIRLSALRLLFTYSTEDHTRARFASLARLIFLFMGINLVDLYDLKDFINGRCVYRRAKTGQIVDFALTKEMVDLASSLLGERALFFPADRYKDVHNFTVAFNRCMAEICKDLRIQKFTSYGLRHTWATIAASLDIPKETIGACLGHAASSVTDIYISFDNKKVDEACAKVARYVLTGVK